MLKFLICLLLFLTNSLTALEKEKPLKVLVLIIGCEKNPLYTEMYKIWRSYMHRFPNEVEAYFMEADPQLKADCLMKDDVIITKTQESLRPGIIIKTLKTLDFLMPRMQEFDYILRTNLSSFYIFPRYMKYLQTLPREKCYCGSPCGYHDHSQPGWRFAQGAGITISRDVAEFLVHNQNQIIAMPDYDDVVIGEFLKPLGYDLIFAPRTDFLSLKSWLDGRNSIPDDAFHFRVKNQDDSRRTTEELYIHWELFKKFYGWIN